MYIEKYHFEKEVDFFFLFFRFLHFCLNFTFGVIDDELQKGVPVVYFKKIKLKINKIEILRERKLMKILWFHPEFFFIYSSVCGANA